MSRFRARYGAPPLHLLALVACFAVAGYAALKWFDAPQVVRLFVWFAGAVIAHVLILYPFYALVDRGIVRSLPVRAVNYVRVPVLLAGLQLLLWWPLITGHREATYRGATGLGTSPYLGHYLLVVAALFGGSALLYAARLVRVSRQHVTKAEDAPPPPEAGEADPRRNPASPPESRPQDASPAQP